MRFWSDAAQKLQRVVLYVKSYTIYTTDKTRKDKQTMWKLMVIAVLVAFVSSAGELYDVVVVGGGPAGIGAALSAAKAGAKTALVERDSVVGGTTVQAKVCDMGLFSAWKRQIIAGPAWDLVTNAVAAAHGTLPDFAAQRPDKWMASCVRVAPEVYSHLAEETLRKAGVTVLTNAEVSSVTRTADGWDTGFAVGRQIVDATGNATVAALAGARPRGFERPRGELRPARPGVVHGDGAGGRRRRVALRMNGNTLV